MTCPHCRGDHPAAAHTDLEMARAVRDAQDDDIMRRLWAAVVAALEARAAD